jgi:hypothetical protein
VGKLVKKNSKHRRMGCKILKKIKNLPYKEKVQGERALG